MWEYTTPSHGLPIGAFFRGESARNAYGKNDDYSIRKGNSTVVQLTVQHGQTGHRNGLIITLDHAFEQVERLHERRGYPEAVPQGVARHGIALQRDLLAKLRFAHHADGLHRRRRRHPDFAAD